MKKLFALVITLVMVLSLLPVGAYAASWSDFTEFKPLNNGNIEGTKHNGSKVEMSVKDYEAMLEDYKEYMSEHEGFSEAAHDPGKHEYIGYGCNTKYHWFQCSCGCRFGEELHVDPKDAPNDTCVCGYHFSSNADLVTLWVKGCPGIKYFDKNKTEYELDAYTYKDVKEIKISTRTHDSEATVELPEDLTLKEGQNKFEVKVTSENQKVTKIYTLIINKEAKK